MLLDLLYLADSAIPIGGAAHSFGLETLVEEDRLGPANLEDFLRHHLAESGALESAYLRRAWRGEDAQALSDEFAARRVARESREATLKMGRRFSQLINAVWDREALPDALHYPVAFGLAGARLEITEQETALAYLRQSVTALVSACQRLMPLGQVEAGRILWKLRGAIAEAAEQTEIKEVGCFTPLPELASARHSLLETRLFIS